MEVAVRPLDDGDVPDEAVHHVVNLRPLEGRDDIVSMDLKRDVVRGSWTLP